MVQIEFSDIMEYQSMTGEILHNVTVSYKAVTGAPLLADQTVALQDALDQVSVAYDPDDFEVRSSPFPIPAGTVLETIDPLQLGYVYIDNKLESNDKQMQRLVQNVLKSLTADPRYHNSFKPMLSSS